MLTGWVRRHTADSASVAGLLLLSVALFGPVVGRVNDWLYGIGNDGVGAPSGIAQFLQASESGGLLAPLPSLTGAPFTQPDVGASADPLWWYSGALIAHVLSPVGAANVLIFVGMAATALATYVFLRRRGLPSSAASLGAFIYGFCPIRLAEAQEHFILLDGFWLVIECALLLALRERRQVRFAVGLGIVVGLAELDNPYVGYFAGVLAAGWFVVLLLARLLRRDWSGILHRAGWAVVALLTIVVVVLPTQLPLLIATASTGVASQSAQTLMRSIGDVDRLSLRWWNFLLPFPENPVLGPLGRKAFYDHLGVDTVSEQSTMIGYVATLLATGGLLWLAHRRRLARSTTAVASSAHARPGQVARAEASARSLASIAGVCIGAGVIFGLPPEFVLGRLHVLTPPYLAHAVLPEIRTTSRIDMLIQLGVAILAAIGAWRLLGRIRSPGWRNAVGIGLAVALLLEYSNVPPWRYVKLLPAPPLYGWLAAQSDAQTGIVAQYPIAASDQAATPLYAFYAYDVHRHRLFNGVLTGTPPDALRRNLEDILNPTNPASWAALGVKTVTVDNTSYRPSFSNIGLGWSDGGAGFIQRLPATLVERYHDAQSTAYVVTAAPAPLVVGLGDDFGAAQLLQDGREWRWIGAQATLWTENVTDHPVLFMAWSTAHNNVAAHRLIWPGYSPELVPDTQEESPVALAVEAAPGLHPLTLRVDGPVAPLQGSGNRTPVSVQVRSFEPAPVRPLTAQFLQDGQPRWTLSAVSTDACTVQAGGTLSVALLWRVANPTVGDQTVFLHMVNGNGDLVAQRDGPPNGLATSRVRAGDRVVDARALLLPSNLSPGQYRLLAGLYSGPTGQRLKLAAGGDTADLGTIAVAAPSLGPSRVPCTW